MRLYSDGRTSTAICRKWAGFSDWIVDCEWCNVISNSKPSNSMWMVHNLVLQSKHIGIYMKTYTTAVAAATPRKKPWPSNISLCIIFRGEEWIGQAFISINSNGKKTIEHAENNNNNNDSLKSSCPELRESQIYEMNLGQWTRFIFMCSSQIDQRALIARDLTFN